jgi:hypothetical protein
VAKILFVTLSCALVQHPGSTGERAILMSKTHTPTSIGKFYQMRNNLCLYFRIDDKIFVFTTEKIEAARRFNKPRGFGSHSPVNQASL